MRQPLFIQGLGDFNAVQVRGFAPRHILADIRSQRGAVRDSLRTKHLEDVPATADAHVTVHETPHTLVFTQTLRHPRLEWLTRALEVWRHEPRARLTLRLNRRSSAAPEILELAFPLPTGTTLPRLSSGGQSFTPFTDQLPGTCRDYFAIDGWAEYATPDGRWLWVSRDAPLVTLGARSTLARRDSPPADPHRLIAILFNNFWYTNFVADEHGILEFQFDLAWLPDSAQPAPDIAATLAADPVLVLNPALPEDPRVLQHLFKP
jgi:hypothetical protein